MLPKTLLFILFMAITSNSLAQNMTSANLVEIIEKQADTVDIKQNSVQFLFKDAMLVCIYDENANRMRIISPIVALEKLEEEQLLNSLVANFHSALDVKYALSDEILWSVYVHPLKELSEAQVIDAINQVHAAAITFGTTYSSTNLIFPGNSQKPKGQKDPDTKILKKF